MEESYWRKVDIPTEAITPDLECLLGLARVMGLNYKVTLTPHNGKYNAEVSWSDEPTDFYMPKTRHGRCSSLGHNNPASALLYTINMYVSNLRRNAEAFRFWEESYRRRALELEKERDNAPS